MTALLVHADTSVTREALPDHIGDFYEKAVYAPLCLTCHEPVPMIVPKLTYRRVGQAYDGTAIFCIARLDVVECYAALIVRDTQDERSHADSENRKHVYRMMKHYRTCIVLDTQARDSKTLKTHEFRAQGLCERELRMLFIVEREA